MQKKKRRKKDGGGSVTDFWDINGIHGLWSLIRINYKKTFMGQLGKFEPWILRNHIKKLL